MQLLKKTVIVTAASSFVLSWMLGAASLASDFPGQGNVSDWSQALPYYNRGNRYLSQGRFTDAISDYRTALSHYDKDPDVYINLGVALRKVDDYAGAEECYRKAASLSPQDWVIWSDLANSCLKQNRLTETIDNFRKAIKCKPPAAERAAMEKDIADITKILTMQGSPPVVPATSPAAATITRQKKQTSAVGARSASAANKTAARIGSPAVNAFADSTDSISTKGQTLASPKIDDKTLKDSGWDYTTK
jgi:tetratricopeptide (TPR) repeat protein